MKKLLMPFCAVFLVVEVYILISFYFKDVTFQLLDPKGPIAQQQKELIVVATLIMLLVAVPMLIVIFFIAFKFRSGNKKATYNPRTKYNRILVSVWWIIPTLVVIAIAATTWKATHKLDPYLPLESHIEPVKIQVIALQWKWLFLYPEEQVATVNFIQVPVDTPVNFELTADAPMNSFWIPSLSGQIYAMTGMSTRLHVLAHTIGDYPGTAAEISGQGFSKMKFVTRVSSDADYKQWIMETKNLTNSLTLKEYEVLAQPSEDTKPVYFGSYDKTLYNKVIDKYMAPEHEHSHTHDD